MNRCRWFTATGKGAVTADGETFDLIDTETPVSSAVRCGCSGNSSFLIGTDRGEIILSVSLAQLFATVSQGDFQQYRERLAAGKSIGSGQVEGACKNLIGKRLKQTGARWRVRRVNNMATLCAVLYGDQWEKYWNLAK